jgi:dihydropteroate synthase
LEYGEDQIQQLAESIKDHNYRIIAEGGIIHLLGSGMNLSNADPFVVFDELVRVNPRNLDASHAFYLGYEMCKAEIALQLSKQYVQDESLEWGHLSKPERARHRLRRCK